MHLSQKAREKLAEGGVFAGQPVQDIVPSARRPGREEFLRLEDAALRPTPAGTRAATDMLAVLRRARRDNSACSKLPGIRLASMETGRSPAPGSKRVIYFGAAAAPLPVAAESFPSFAARRAFPPPFPPS